MKKFMVLSIILIFSLSAASADDTVRYTNDSFARLSYINGNVYIQRAAELDYEEAMVNMPVTEGDRIGTTEGRAEIYMGRGKYLRVDYNTKMDFLDLPRPGNDLTRVQIWKGNIVFSIISLKKEKMIEIHTDDTSLYILEPGLYRIDVREGETEILVFKGLAEAAGETGSILIRDEQRVEAIDGHFLGRPAGFAAVAGDSFDRWSEQRENEIRKRMAERYLPDELEDFEYELATYGAWAYVFPYGNVWVPGGIGADWRPYWHGRWMWLPVCGWAWLPYEPWGWVTAHYGRWHWSAGFGWYWIPTAVWGPGWVHWYSGYDYVGWVPANFWGRPGVIIDNAYYGRNAGNSYVRGSRALTVIHKDQLKARDISRIALSKNSVKNIGNLSLVKAQPAVKQARSSKIRLKSLRRGSSATPESTYTPSIKITKSDSSKRIKITSPDIKKASTTLGKITNILSDSKNQATKSNSRSSKRISPKSKSSKNSSSKKIKSSSISKSKTSSSVKKSSSPKSSSRTRSSSKRVKKKK